MTSEELILLLDNLQPTLPKCANQVLLRLVAKCIASGTNEVDISAAELARDLGISRDAVKVACRALSGMITTRGGNGVGTVWILPADWFVVQRSLFAIPSSVENRLNLPGNQAAVAWKPGNQPDDKPGRTGLETRQGCLVTRQRWTSFQAGTPLETRQAETENQQVTPFDLPGNQAILDRSSRVLSSVATSVSLRDSIEGVNHLPEELGEHAAELKRSLREYFVRHHPSHTVQDGPDEIILAKCLAISPLRGIVSVLESLHRKNTRPGDTWAWFVTVFCSRIHRTRDLATVRAHPAFHQPKKNPSSERGGGFSADLLQEIAAGAPFNF